MTGPPDVPAEHAGGDAALGLRPAGALGAALASAAFVALVVVVALPRERWPHLLVYDTPIAVPFVLFVLERWHGRRSWRGGARVLDLGVVGLALVRPASIAVGLAPFPPFVSGHALFLAYALLTTRSALGRAAAALVLAQVVYMKVVLWSDPSVAGGVLLGLVAWRLRRPYASASA